MKVSITGQETVTFWYSWLLNRGDHMGRFNCRCLGFLFNSVIHQHLRILRGWVGFCFFF